jgi:hypothetical protein
MVLPNPSWIVLTIVLTGRTAKARKIETRNRATNASSFMREVSSMIAIMLIPTMIEVSRILIFEIYVNRICNPDKI